jgi:hypothetical protein
MARDVCGCVHKLLWIAFAAFAIRVAVRLYSGSEDFWPNGYPFFFATSLKALPLARA